MFEIQTSKMSKLLPLVFIIIVLSIGILTQTPFTDVPKIFAHSTKASQTSKMGSLPSPSSPPPPQFGPPSPEMSATQKSASTNKTCIVMPSKLKLHGSPQQTEGPYFVDDMPNRSDIRSDPSTGMIQQGIPLHLVIHIYSLNNGICTPIRAVKVDIWHANSQGIYSAVKDFGTTGQQFLRGYQTTGNDGSVHFTTVYPGWYQGRTIHIHVKVRTFEGSNKTMDWTSQFYFDNNLNKQIHTQLPYSKHGPPTTTNEQDGIYTGPSTDGLIKDNSGQHMLLNVSKEGQGYLGTFNIVLSSTT